MKLASPILAFVIGLLLSACAPPAADRGTGAPTVTVSTQRVQAQAWRDSLEALGTAQANESVWITAKVTETVVRVNFEDGQLAEAGQVLVDLSGKVELAGLAEAAAAYRDSAQQYRRAQQLTEQKLLPASQLDSQRASLDAARARLDATRARLADRVITAPFAGRLGFRQVSPGSLVTPGTVITSLDDVSLIKLDFALPERWLSALSPGQAVVARSAAFPGRDFAGVVRALGARVDPRTRAITVRAELANPELALRPGMLLTVRLALPERQALVVPEIAIVQIGEQAQVFRVRADDTVEAVSVRLGQRREGEVEVLSGLAAGERLVVDGTVKLRPGSRIVEAGEAAAAKGS